MNRHRFIVLCAFIVAVSGVCTSAQSRPFTVRDSIEMTTFSDPNSRTEGANATLSPDEKRFFVVTTRGILEENKLESTIWVFDAAPVVAYVNGRASQLRPSP